VGSNFSIASFEWGAIRKWGELECGKQLGKIRLIDFFLSNVKLKISLVSNHLVLALLMKKYI
jgi:hypothetical protein